MWLYDCDWKRRCIGTEVKAAVQGVWVAVGCSFRLKSAERSGFDGGASMLCWLCKAFYKRELFSGGVQLIWWIEFLAWVFVVGLLAPFGEVLSPPMSNKQDEY